MTTKPKRSKTAPTQKTAASSAQTNPVADGAAEALLGSAYKYSILANSLPEDFEQRVRVALDHSPTAEAPTASDSSANVKGSKKTCKPNFDLDVSNENLIYDYGLFQVHSKGSNRGVDILRDGVSVENAIYAGAHPEHVRTLQEALHTLEHPTRDSPLRLLTSQMLLRTWLLLERASKPIEEAINWILEADCTYAPASDDGRSKLLIGRFRGLLPADFALKAAISFGGLVERFRLLDQGLNALSGKRLTRARSQSGKGKESKSHDKYRVWLESVQTLVGQGKAKSINDACREVAENDLRSKGKLNGLSSRESRKKVKSYVDSVRPHLNKHFAQELERLADKLNNTRRAD